DGLRQKKVKSCNSFPRRGSGSGKDESGAEAGSLVGVGRKAHAACGAKDRPGNNFPIASSAASGKPGRCRDKSHRLCLVLVPDDRREFLTGLSLSLQREAPSRLAPAAQTQTASVSHPGGFAQRPRTRPARG